MELRIVILSVACFSFLLPPALTTPILAKKVLLAKGALVAKGAAAIAKGAVAKGVMLAKGALAAKGAAIGSAVAKGAMLTKGVLAAKGALVAKGVLAAKGLLAAKKAFAAKGLMFAKGVAAAAVAKGFAAKVAVVKGAAAFAKGAAGLAASKASMLFKHPVLALPAAPVGIAGFAPLIAPLSAIGSRQPIEVQQVAVVDPVSGIANRIGQWAGAIGGALAEQNAVASDLVTALSTRVASESSPFVK